MSESQSSQMSVPESREALKELIKTRLEKACNDLPDWHWRIDDDINLERLVGHDREKVEKLLFGRLDDVTGDWDEASHDSLSDRRDANVKEELDAIIDRELESVINLFAERNDLDVDELVEELKEEFISGSWELEIPQPYVEYSYKGEVTVVAETPLSLDFIPNSALFHALRFLRIAPDAYLAACREYIDEMGDDISLDEPGVFAESLERLPDSLDLDAFDGVAHAYEFVFWEGAKDTNDSSLFPAPDPRAAAVKPIDLVKFMAEASDLSEVFVHMTCSGDTVKSVSNEIACHGLDVDSTVLMVPEGILVEHRNPDYVDSSLALSGPIPIQLKRFEVRKEGGDSVSREVSFAPGLAAETRLYRALIDLERGDRNSAPTEASLLEMADAMPLNRAEPFAREKSLMRDQHLNDLGTKVRDRLLARAAEPLTDEMRGKGLLHCLAADLESDVGQSAEALWLISKGADVNARLENGVTPLMLAARRRDPALVQALLDAGADIHAEAVDNLSGCPDNALSIATRLTAAGPTPGSCRDLLIDAGARLPVVPLREGREYRGHVSPVVFAARSMHPELVRRTAEDLVAAQYPDLQAQLNEGLYLACVRWNEEVACALVEKGANPSGTFTNRAGRERTVIAALSEYCVSVGRKLEEVDNFVALLRAHLARLTIQNVTSSVRAALASRRTAR